MATTILLLLLGLASLIIGANWLVDGASALAKRYNISDLAIGLTIVAFGTSAPELVVNTIAAFQGHHDIVFGNVIGSNNINLFVILGISGLIIPLTVKSSTVWKEIPLSLFAVIVLYVLCNNFLTGDKILARFDGILLLALFALFLLYVFKQLKSDSAQLQVAQKNLTTLKIWGYIIIGLLGLVVGGRLVVTNAVHMSTVMGMSEKMIGLTIVAIGTSLPELATSIVAAIKKNNDIAVGSIIGSNIFNIFFILAVSSMIMPIGYDSLFNRDLYLLAGGTAFLFIAMFTGQKKKLDRWEAGVLLVVYIAYMIFIIKNNL